MSVTLDGVLQTICAMDRYSRGGFAGAEGAAQLPTAESASSAWRNPCGRQTATRAWIPAEEIEAAKHFIKLAVLERGGSSIPSFNDSRWSYRPIAEVIARAKQLAAMAYHAHAQRRLPAPVAPVIDTKPVRQAPVAPLALPPPAGSSSFFAGLFSKPAPVTPAVVNPWAAREDRD